MIILLHGDDIVKSRNELRALKESSAGREIRFLDGRTIEEGQFIQSLSSQSLFGEEIVVVIENLCSANAKKTKRLESLLALVVSEGKANTIILWEEKEVGKTALSALAGTSTIRLFKLPTVIFQLLDGLRPGNVMSSLRLLNTILEEEPPELIHAMLIKRVRQLLLLDSGGSLENVQSWQLGRLTNQGKFFSLEKKVALYHDMLHAEFLVKTGMSSLSLTEHIQQYLLLNL